MLRGPWAEFAAQPGYDDGGGQILLAGTLTLQEASGPQPGTITMLLSSSLSLLGLGRFRNKSR